MLVEMNLLRLEISYVSNYNYHLFFLDLLLRSRKRGSEESFASVGRATTLETWHCLERLFPASKLASIRLGGTRVQNTSRSNPSYHSIWKARQRQ